MKAGLPEMWAEFAANRAKHFAAQAAEYVGVMPKEWYEKNKITFMNSMRTDWERAGKPESVSYKNTMGVDTRLQLQPSGMTADGGQKEDLELALKNERFFQFAGSNAENADRLALNQAKEMDKSGADSETIRKQTGWFKGADGKWRFEISDKDAEILPSALEHFAKYLAAKYESNYAYRQLEELRQNPTKYKPEVHKELIEQYEKDLKKANKEMFELGDELRLGDVLKHDKLFKAYPYLRDVKVIISDMDASGRYYPYHNEIELDADMFDARKYRYNKFYPQEKRTAEIKKVLMHEIQHAIQQKEGFAEGGNPAQFADRARQAELKRDLARLKEREQAGEDVSEEIAQAEFELNSIEEGQTDKYLHLAGEIEARNTEKRADMSDQERMDTAPQDTQDYKDSDAIIVFDDGSAMAYNPQDNNKNKQQVVESVQNMGTGRKTVAFQDKKDIFKADSDVSKKFEKEIKEAIDDKNFENNTIFDMGKIPAVYHYAGLPIEELKTNKLSLRKAIGTITPEELAQHRNWHNHNVPRAVVNKLVDFVADPVAILKSESETKRKQEKFLAVLDAKFEDKQIVAIISPSETGKGFTFIPTAYERAPLEEMLKRAYEKKGLLYIDEKRASIPVPSVQTGVVGKEAPTNNILTKEDIVKGNFILVNGKKRHARNSEGNMIHGTVEGLRAFWNWFGDSIVVDEQGRPLVVYHGTNKEFNSFKQGNFPKLLKMGAGIYFTDNQQSAIRYAQRFSDGKGVVMPVYLSLQNPLILESPLSPRPQDMSKYDGIIAGEKGNLEIVVFEPNQIKSVNNTGEFDVNNKDIFYQKQNNQQAVDLTAEFANIKGLTAQNAQQLIEQELNKLIGKPLDTATPPLQIQITSGNKVHIKRPNVPLKGGKLVRHQAVLSALEKVVNKAEKADKDGTVDLTHNTSKRTLTHKAGVDKYVYFKAPVQAEITDENGQKSTVYFEVELAAEQVKGQDPNLLDLYNVRVKKSSPHTHLSASAGNTNSITNNGQNNNSFKQDDKSGEDTRLQPSGMAEPIGARGYVQFSTQGAFMHLLETADPSTILHETSGHIQLRNIEQMRDIAETNGATDEFWDIWQRIENWLGKAQRIENADGSVSYRFNTEQQEMFAEGMEKMYIAGKAPTTGLQKVFEYFKQMLSVMYEEAKEWLDLRPEVEELFEKILAAPQSENADSKIYKGRAKDIKAVAQKAREGQAATINGMGIKEVKALIKQLSKRRPAMPKDDLYTVLKRKGADYDNAAQIDKEAYENAGIKNKKDGIGDKLAQFLYNEGFLAEGYGETYEEQRKLDETAADMINRALDGEKIYKLDDQEKAAQVENFDANMQTIREAFGNNVEQAEQTLRAIEDLQAQGYRVIGNSDIEYAEKETGKLLSFAEKEREFKAKIEKLTKDKEELANVAQRRLIEIGRSATAAREEGYKEAIKDAQDEKTVKDLLTIEREAYKNALDARRVKRTLTEELNKRELENKQEMLKELSEAKTNEEIYKAAQKLMGVLYRAYEQSEAGKAEKAKTDIPKTNWGLVKLNAVKKFKEIAQKATAEIEQARALDKEASVMRAKGQKPDQNKQAQIDNARNKILKGYGLKYAKALKEAFYAVPHIDNVWLDKQANYLGAEYARGHNILGAELDNMIERAKKRQSENYKKYIAAKIEKMISAGYKVKDGQKQKGKYDYLTNKLFEDLKNIGTMDRTFAKKELEKREKIAHNAPSPAEAVLQVLGLEGDADNIDAGLVDNMKLENMYLKFKAGKMNKEEMSAQKEYFQAEGLPDTIGTDEWYYVSAELLGQFYKELNERRQAALEGRLAKSLKRALKEQQEREAFGAAVKKNAKAGFSLVANWESYLNTVANEEAKEKYSLLLEEAKAETRVHQKMGEIIRAASNALNTNNAEDVKKWFDSLDDKVITVKNRIESKRKALQDNDVYIRSKIEMMEQFRNLLAGKNEVVLKNALTLREGQRRGDFNVKVVYDRAGGGLRKIYDGGGIEAVMRAVSLIPKGFIDEYSQAAKKYKDDDVILLKNSNDFSAVLKYNEVGGKGTYTLIDFVKYDKDGKQIAGYGLPAERSNNDAAAEYDNNNDNTSKDKFFHAAAMYKTPHKNFKDFYNAAQNNKGKKQFFYTYTTKSGVNIDIPSDTVLHDNKHPEMTADEWKKGLSYIDNIEDSLYTKPRFSNGTGILLKVNAENSKYGAEITLTPSGRIILNTLFKSTDEGINAWIEKEKENAVVSAPLRRGQALKNNRDVISGHSPINSLADILKNANTQKETFFQGNDESLQEKIDRTNQDNNVNSKEIESEIRKAALNAAANVINPFVDTVYAPVEQELTKGEIIDIYNTCKNDIGYARYENQYGYDQLTEMFALLSPREKQIADMWQKTVEGGYDEVNDVFIKQYGLDMGKPENYWPFSVDRIESEIDMLGSNYREASRPGMTKSRTRGTLVEMKPQNPKILKILMSLSRLQIC